MERFVVRQPLNEDIDRAITTGKDNAAIRSDCEGWCRHVVIETLDVSPVGQMAGVPIGPHRVSCKHAAAIESTCLRNLFTSFLGQYCDGCEHYIDGDLPQFGTGILEDIRNRKLEGQRAKDERHAAVTQLRKQLVDRVAEFADAAEPEAASIHRLAADLFLPDPPASVLSALFESCNVAPEFFDVNAIDVLVNGVSDDEFAERCLQVLSALARARPSVCKDIRESVLSTLERNLSIEVVSDAIDSCVDPATLTADQLRQLILRLDHQLRIADATILEPPAYPKSTDFLARVYSANPALLESVFVSMLKDDNTYTRSNACEAAVHLAEHSTLFGLRILKSVVAMIQFAEEMHFGVSSDHSARKFIAKMLASEWNESQEIFVNEIVRLPVGARSGAFGAYELMFRLGPDWREETTDGLDDGAVSGATSHCLSVFCDSNEVPDIRRAAAEALETAAAANVQLVITSVDRILGAYVLMSDSEAPSPVPKIVMPGQAAIADHDQQMRNHDAEMAWNRLKHEAKELLEEIGKHAGSELCETLIKAIESSTAVEQSKFRVRAVELLGKVASDNPDCTPLALPTFMKGMMDFSDSLLRAISLDAAATAFRYRRYTVPENVSDAVILHLRDTYVCVHKAAVRTLRFSWLNFNQKQREEAFQAIVVLWDYYTKQPGDLFFREELADAMMSVSKADNDMRAYSLRLICRAVPSGERLVDSKLCETILRHSNYDDKWAIEVAVTLILCMTKHSRDLHRSGSDWRDQTIRWLHQMPTDLWIRVRRSMSKSAFKCAERDPFDAYVFAAIFSEHGDHYEEKCLLKAGAESARDHHMFHGLEEALLRMADRAEVSAGRNDVS